MTEEAKKWKAQILETLREVIDPELGINIVDRGLVYSMKEYA